MSTSTELTARPSAGTTLTIDPAQAGFTGDQVAALQHLGVDGASDGDLAVFFHVVKRTGLDPFARQIYMIGRNTYDQRQDRWVTKQTIQTGIDGYRLIGRRAADRARVAVSVGAPEWAHPDGTWRPVWTKGWGDPVAARITIERDGHPFTAVALFEEYVQTKRNGDPTQMWAQRPAGQIAKCAEALAWRMAFPQDLAGVYVEDELQHADNQPTSVQQEAPRGGAPVTAAELLGEDVQDAEVEDEEPDQGDGAAITDPQLRKLGVLMRGWDRARALAYVTEIVGRPVSSRRDLSKAEASDVIDALERDEPVPPEAEGGDPS